MSNTSKAHKKNGEYRLAIYYEDTDFSGYVYHANYLKYLDRAREDLFGLDMLIRMFQDGYQFVVGKAELTYKRPAKHGDHLLVTTDVEYSRSPLLKCFHKVYVEESDQKVLIHEARIDLVVVDQGHRPARLPDLVFHALGGSKAVAMQSAQNEQASSI